MRKFLAGRLIRLAHRIYPPRVTEQQYADFVRHTSGPYVYGGGEADGLSYMAAVESTLHAQNRLFTSGGQVRDMGPRPRIPRGWN